MKYLPNTRVMTWLVFHYLATDENLAKFSDAYPHVDLDDVYAFLRLACKATCDGYDLDGHAE